MINAKYPFSADHHSASSVFVGEIGSVNMNILPQVCDNVDQRFLTAIPVISGWTKEALITA